MTDTNRIERFYPTGDLTVSDNRYLKKMQAKKVAKSKQHNADKKAKKEKTKRPTRDNGIPRCQVYIVGDNDLDGVEITYTVTRDQLVSALLQFQVNHVLPSWDSSHLPLPAYDSRAVRELRRALLLREGVEPNPGPDSEIFEGPCEHKEIEVVRLRGKRPFNRCTHCNSKVEYAKLARQSSSSSHSDSEPGKSKDDKVKTEEECILLDKSTSAAMSSDFNFVGQMKREITIPRVVLERRRLLDGYRLTTDNSYVSAQQLCREMHADFVRQICHRQQYTGESRLVVNRGVKEIKQDLVVVSLTMRIKSINFWLLLISFLSLAFCFVIDYYTQRWDEFVLSLLSEFLFSFAVITQIASRSLAGFIMFFGSVSSKAHSVRGILSTLSVLYAIGWSGHTVQQQSMAMIVMVIKMLAGSLTTLAVGPQFRLMCLLVHIGIVISCNLYLSTYVKLLSVWGNDLFWVSERNMWYCPHAVSSVMAEFPMLVNEETVRLNCRSKLLRLAALPIPDVAASQILSGTERVCLFALAHGRSVFDLEGRYAPPAL